MTLPPSSCREIRVWMSEQRLLLWLGIGIASGPNWVSLAPIPTQPPPTKMPWAVIVSGSAALYPIPMLPFSMLKFLRQPHLDAPPSIMITMYSPKVFAEICGYGDISITNADRARSSQTIRQFVHRPAVLPDCLNLSVSLFDCSCF